MRRFLAAVLLCLLVVPATAQARHRTKVERQVATLRRQMREQQRLMDAVLATSNYQTVVLNCVQWMPVRTTLFQLPGAPEPLPLLSWTVTDETAPYWVAFADRGCLDRIDAYAASMP